MEPSDALVVAAEISFGLAGMAGIIASLRGVDMRQSEVVGLTVLIFTAFASGFGALIPMLFLSMDLTTAEVWSISSTINALVGAAGFALGFFGIKNTKYFGENRLSMIIFSITIIACIVINASNATGYFFEPSFAPIFGTGLAVLGISCYLFAVMLLVPAWRVVQERKSEVSSEEGT